ncbi:swr1 complex component [Coemansia sp. BCRC 34301]|nr:swr1 complex component [Coemansia sp. BCRC 34301]
MVVNPMVFVTRAKHGSASATESRDLAEYMRSFVTLPDDTVLSSLPPHPRTTAAERKPGAMTKPELVKSKRDLLAEKREREAAMREKFAEWVSSMARIMYRVSELRRLGMLRDSSDPQSALSVGDDDRPSCSIPSSSGTPASQVICLLKMPALLPPALPEPAPKAREPPRPKSVWDQVLVDAIDRHKEMTLAFRRRRTVLRKCSRQIEREDEERKARLGIFKRPEMAERAERESQRRLAKWTAQQVLKKWLYVESIMDEQRQIEEDELRSKQDKRVLFDMLHRSTQLLEGQRKVRRSSSVSSALSDSDREDATNCSYESQSRRSRRRTTRIDESHDNVMSMESMRECLPSSGGDDDDDDDDEDAAISPEQSDVEFASESSANDDSSNEMNELALDQDVPVESLLSQYYEMQQQRQSSPMSSEDESDEEMSDAASEDSNLGIEELAAKTPQHAVEQPFLLRGNLREYQRQGLDWLASLHQHQINGILADEMGLGKTIQTIALLAHLACHRGIWGPHLVIVPTSVLLNWEQEFHRWLPGFKVLTYYGSRAERKQKRKGWSKPNALHVCVTSYQLAIQDAAVFRRKPWYYMILDEAQAIKNFRSQRWQTLLGVKSACRLLLTGTPLQNSLIELWSLMYFLMPQEFGSGDGDEGGEALGFAGLERFREWFSQPLEKLLAVRPDIAAPVGRGTSEKVAFNTTSFLQGGGETTESSSMALSTQAEAQQAVQKLHTVLRPHILRRLKQDVETQLPDKTEHVVYCHLSKRQRLLYDDFMSRSQTRETLQAGTYLGVMGCLMQLRKVCNHPDLFETRPIVTSWVMSGAPIAVYGRTEDLVRRMLAGGYAAPFLRQSPMPWQDQAGQTAWRLRGLAITSCELETDMVAWKRARQLDATPALLLRGLERARDALDPTIANGSDWDKLQLRPYASRYRSVRGYTELQYHASNLRSGDTWMRLAAQNACRVQGLASKPVYGSGLLQAVGVARGVHERLGELATGLVLSGKERLERYNDTIQNYVFATPAVLVTNTASDREAVLPHMRLTCDNARIKELVPNILHLRRRVARHTMPVRPLEQRLQIAFPEPFLLQYDCGKLQALDQLLGRLVREGHRALVFTQMTKVLDILEQWLNLHGYRYLRLDGATKVEQRWRLTERFNHDPKWTVFISSTRAGGLGINLTGADTVIFYDSDWNHAMDAQCQDRCHRIGQQREVHIYRLISERTIEEAIWKKQCQKRWLNQVVIQEGRFDPNAERNAGHLGRADAVPDDVPTDGSGMTAASALGVGDWYELASAVLTQSATLGNATEHSHRQAAVSERDAAQMLSAAEDEVDAMALKVAIAEVAQADALDMGDEFGSKAVEETADRLESADPAQEPDEHNDDGIGHIDDYMFRFNLAAETLNAEAEPNATEPSAVNESCCELEPPVSFAPLIASNSGSKRRGGSVTEREHCEVKVSEVIQGPKRHRIESAELQMAQAATAAQDPGADRAGDGAGECSDDEDLNIDGSYAPSPLAGLDTEDGAMAHLRYSLEEMELVRSEAYALGFSAFLQKYVVDMGVSVRSLLEVFCAQPFQGFAISDIQSLQLLKYHLGRFYRNRPRLSDVNSIEDVVRLLKQSKRIMVLTGAGVSVSCGIPDFRSPTGIYTRLNDEFGLDDPQQMFDIEYFRETPELFYSFAKELYPYSFTPAPSHAFIKLLEDKEKLLRNYTQNIDTLEHVQGIKSVLNCHGSFATATCIKCGYKCDGKDLEDDIMAMRIAYCPVCKDGPRKQSAHCTSTGGHTLDSGGDSGSANHIYKPGDSDEDDDDDDADYGSVQGIMKPDITFFGEMLPDKFNEALLLDRENVDLLLVMGSSLKVAPVSDIMSHLPHAVPQIVINKTPIVHLNFDVQLLGNADDIVAYLASACGWTLCHSRIPGGSTDSAEYKQSAPAPIPTPETISVAVRSVNPDNPDSIELSEKTYHVPSHWHPFPSADITGKDLLIASGDAKVRLAIDSSDEECESGSDISEEDSDNDGDPMCPNGEDDEGGDRSDDSVGSESLARDIGKTTV